MKASSRRPEQVAETLRQVITDALARDVRDPRVGFVTVTGVLVTGDLSHARVMVSVPGRRRGEGARARGPAERRRLPPLPGGPRARPRGSCPSCTSSWTAGLEHAARINELLKGIRQEGQRLIGAVLVDKPAGPTSHDVVQRVRRALGTRAVGHTGTLDPFATGLLVLLVGRATRLARFVEGQPKTYLATARLGQDRHRRRHRPGDR